MSVEFQVTKVREGSGEVELLVRKSSIVAAKARPQGGTDLYVLSGGFFTVTNSPAEFLWMLEDIEPVNDKPVDTTGPKVMTKTELEEKLQIHKPEPKPVAAKKPAPVAHVKPTNTPPTKGGTTSSALNQG